MGRVVDCPLVSMSTLAIVEAFSDLPDARRGAGRRHQQALCLALFTLAMSVGCQGFLAISDWLDSYRAELLELFSPPKDCLTFLQYDSSSIAELGLQSLQPLLSPVLRN